MSDTPYNPDGTVDWSFFDRPAVPGMVYVTQDGEYTRDPVTLESAQENLGYGSMSDYDKRQYYNEEFGNTIPVVPPIPVDIPNTTTFEEIDDKILNDKETESLNPNSEISISTAGIDLSGFYDKFLSGMPPFSLFPGGALFEFGQGLFDKDKNPDTPAESFGQNVSGTVDIFSNPLILMVLIMGMTGRGGNSMSSLLPLLILLPMLSGQNITGGDMQ